MTRSQAAEQTTLKQISEKCLNFSEKQLQKINECLRIINFSKFSYVVRTLATVQVLAKAWINRIKPITLNTESKMVMVLKPDQLKAARNMFFSINQIGLNETKYTFLNNNTPHSEKRRTVLIRQLLHTVQWQHATQWATPNCFNQTNCSRANSCKQSTRQASTNKRWRHRVSCNQW